MFLFAKYYFYLTRPTMQLIANMTFAKRNYDLLSTIRPYAMQQIAN